MIDSDPNGNKISLNPQYFSVWMGILTGVIRVMLFVVSYDGLSADAILGGPVVYDFLFILGQCFLVSTPLFFVMMGTEVSTSSYLTYLLLDVLVVAVLSYRYSN